MKVQTASYFVCIGPVFCSTLPTSKRRKNIFVKQFTTFDFFNSTRPQNLLTNRKTTGVCKQRKEIVLGLHQRHKYSV